jgi:hypothetical protein
MKQEYCKELYTILKNMEDGLGKYVFKELQGINISYFQGDEANTLAAYNPYEKILKINGQFYGLLANKELEEIAKKIRHSMFKITITHELWHYYIREFNFRNGDEWKKIVKFYKDNEEVILDVFSFINVKVPKTNKKGETYKEDVYSEEQRPEEFIVEAIAYLEAGCLNNEREDAEYIKMVNFIQEIYKLLTRK